MSMTGLIDERIRSFARPQVVTAGGVLEKETADDEAAEKPNKDVSDQLAKYIPSEALALYLGAVSAASALENHYAFQVYWLFVVFTPVLFILLYMGKRRSVGETVLPKWADVGQFPWWRLVASSIAFAFWALAVPKAPYLTSGGERAIAAFLALFVATMLPILEPIFDLPRKSSS